MLSSCAPHCLPTKSSHSLFSVLCAAASEAKIRCNKAEEWLKEDNAEAIVFGRTLIGTPDDADDQCIGGVDNNCPHAG